MGKGNLIDSSSDFGMRVERRLLSERVGWLVTVRPDGTPEPSPVWFIWDGECILIYSQPGKQKIRNLQRNPAVAFHLDGDGQGGDIIIFTGTAVLDPNELPAHRVPAYREKYTEGFERIGMTAETFSNLYSVAIKVVPEKLRGH